MHLRREKIGDKQPQKCALYDKSYSEIRVHSKGIESGGWVDRDRAPSDKVTFEQRLE